MLDPTTLGAQRQWLANLFTALAYWDEDEDLFYLGPSNDCQACQALNTNNITNLPTTIAAIAQSLTEQIRLPQLSTYLDGEYVFNLTDTVAGIAQHSVIVNNVDWRWLILPCAVQVGGVLFVGVVVGASRRAGTRLWKSSVLPVLFHGLDGEGMREGGKAVVMHEMEELAESVVVRLGVSEREGGLMLVRA